MASLLRLFLTRVVRQGRLEVERSSGAKFSVGDGTGQAVAVRLTDRAAEWQLVLDPTLALGELFTDGRMVMVRGRIYDLLELVARNIRTAYPSRLTQIREWLRSTPDVLYRRNSVHRAKRNVAHHYDLDSRLYALFLDGDWQYSCAYFERAGQDLEEAQLAKKRHIAAKLLIEPSHRVLDIGSGWGGLALYLAQQCGANVTGITLSEEQLELACQRSQSEQLASRVEFRLQDYRSVSEHYDRIVSVGMFEHVGAAYYNSFFERARDLLTDDGVMLLHTIGRSDGPGSSNAWIAKYIFPGGYVPALSEMSPAIERSGLIVTDIEILRLHYAETLRAWRDRFLARWSDAAQIYDERFCRLWEFYLSACEAGFRHCGLVVFQIQLAKHQNAVPLTRDYIGMRSANLAACDSGPTALSNVAAE